MVKRIVLPSGSHHFCLPFITSIARAAVLDWTLAYWKYSHISRDCNIFIVKIFFGTGSFTDLSSSKITISRQGIKSLDHLKSLSKNAFAFWDPAHANLSLARFSNARSLEKNLRGFSINVLAQLADPVIWGLYFYLYHESVNLS